MIKSGKNDGSKKPNVNKMLGWFSVGLDKGGRISRSGQPTSRSQRNNSSLSEILKHSPTLLNKENSFERFISEIPAQAMERSLQQRTPLVMLSIEDQ